MQRNNTRHLARKSGGYTIVEVMIALTLGMVLISSIFNFLLVGVQTYSSQAAVSELQDKSRVVFDILTSQIRLAGYSETTLAGGRLTNAITGTEGASGATDSIALSAESGPITEISAPLMDCAGNSYPGAAGSATDGVTTMTNTFAVVGNQIRCTNGVGGTVTLASNIEDFQLLYGIDLTSDGVPNQYLDADNATMTDAVSTEICLIVRSEDNAVGVASSYTDCSGDTVTPTDFRLRRTMNLVVNLRN